MLKYFTNKNKIVIAVITLISLLIFNYKVIVFGLNSDCIGILVSIGLFIYGGKKTNVKINYFLFFIIILLEFVSYRLHTKSLHFLSIALFICLVYYYFTQKFSVIAVVCILLFSSVFNKFFEHLTTEIKQQLCYLVYVALKNPLNITKIEGVNFYINDAKITIDTACMGLAMFKTGLLFAAVLLTIEEKKQQKTYTILSIILFCTIVIFLNIVSNYFRIISLVILKCTEENWLHHSIGLFCFILYQIFPMLIFIKHLKPRNNYNSTTLNNLNLVFLLACFVLIFFTSLEMKQTKNNNLLTNLSSNYNQKNGHWVNTEVFKIETEHRITYIKTPIHKPLICWTGDGYKITESKKITQNQQEIWFNKMEKNGKIYHSVWWYECGNKKYTSFIEVMWQKLIFNETIRLINEVEIKN